MHPRSLLPLFAAAFLSLGASFLSAAETAFVTGRVSNAATGDYLANVAVALEGTGTQVATDIDGRYRIAVPSGAVRLVVRYPGLDDQGATVEAAAGRPATRDFALTSAVTLLEKYVVKGLAEGQAAAIQEERNAANLRTVAAIDAHGNPGSSVGELIQRLAGISIDGAGGEVGAIYVRGMTQDFSSLMVDGAQIAVSGGTSISNGNVYFGQVSTGALAAAEVIKSPTAAVGIL